MHSLNPIIGAQKVGVPLRKLFLGFLVVLTLLLASCSGRGSVSVSPSNSLVTFIDIDRATLTGLLDSEIDMIVLISSETCSSCAAFEPIIIDYIELHHIPIYRIEADEAFPTDNSILAYEYTPTLVLINEGKIVSHVDSFSDEEIFLTIEGLSDYFDRFLTLEDTYKAS